MKAIQLKYEKPRCTKYQFSSIQTIYIKERKNDLYKDNKDQNSQIIIVIIQNNVYIISIYFDKNIAKM